MSSFLQTGTIFDFFQVSGNILLSVQFGNNMDRGVMVDLSHNFSILIQVRNEGTSRVAFEVLIINCQIDFINLFIFNCLTLNIKFFIFKLFDFKFLFSENHVFRKQKRTTIYGLTDVRPYFRILNSPGKMMTSYPCEINEFLSYRTLCKSILKRGFPTEGIKLTWFVFLRYSEYLSFSTWFRPFQ